MSDSARSHKRLSDCWNCGHPKHRHPGGVCRISLTELPSCLDCREFLKSLRNLPVSTREGDDPDTVEHVSDRPGQENP